ncbi:MAG: ArsR/SmtB family transcription factor [Flavobacteriales bacterium]
MNVEVILKALSNPMRREILLWLKSPEQYFPTQELPHSLGVCAGQIDQRAGLSQSTISNHLAILQKAELISCRKVGQWCFFQRNDATIAAFVAQLQLDL